MKTIIFTLIATAILTTTLNAQVKPVVKAEPVEQVEPVEKVEIVEPIIEDGIQLGISESVMINDTIDPSENADTTIIRIGKKEIIVIDEDDADDDSDFDEDNDQDIDEDEDNDNVRCYQWNWGHKKDREGKFDGHWEALELGFNGFDKEDYSMYNGNEFMSLNQGKSMEFNVNFYELNIGLVKSYVGLVSGLGLSFNSYRFENDYTIERDPERVKAIPLEYEDLSKTKLAVSYVRVPLLFEFQIPVNQHEGRVYVNAGVIGGVRIGSHTKVKHGDIKDKVRSGFNMNAFNYAATARVGYKDVGFFATYSMTPLFETGQGPDLTPFSIGISFSN